LDIMPPPEFSVRPMTRRAIMSRLVNLTLFLAGVVTTGCESPESTAGNGGQTPTATVEDSPVLGAAGGERALLAARLAVEGARRRSPILMLASVEVLADLIESERSDEAVELESRDAKLAIPFTLDELLDRAETFAEGDEQTVKFVQKVVEDMQTRQLDRGQGKALETVYVEQVPFKALKPGVVHIEVGGWHRWNNVVFKANEPAMVSVVGASGGSLEVVVRDGSAGSLIDKASGGDSVRTVAWTPRDTAPVSIVVSNTGRVAEECVVLVNW
jgi:hypothetical protein